MKAKKFFANYLYPIIDALLPIYLLIRYFELQNSRRTFKPEFTEIMFTEIFGLGVGCILPVVLILIFKLDFSEMLKARLLLLLTYPVAWFLSVLTVHTEIIGILILAAAFIFPVFFLMKHYHIDFETPKGIATFLVLLMSSPVFVLAGFLIDFSISLEYLGQILIF